MSRGRLGVSLLVLTTACNFDEAFRRYCENNPQCDGGTTRPSDGSAAREVVSGPPIPPPRNCGPYNPCPYPGEVCHPFGLVCLQSCTSAADCPPWLDTCTEIRDPNGTVWTPKVCTCTRAQVCADYQDGFTCNSLDGLCERLCATTPDCYGFQGPRVCDQLYGLCLLSSAICRSNADCPTAIQPRCDPVILRCAGCATFYDCAGRPDGRTVCGSNGTCAAP
jgi:hypothetical protein